MELAALAGQLTDPMAPVTLVALAGGKSTRFGRPKQLEPVGPNGEALLDITLRNALRAGCTSAIIVVRPEHEKIFAGRYANDPWLQLVVQHEARGTAHAVMQVVEHLQGTMIIANGDDHYGEGSMRMAMHHATHGPPEEHAMVGFRLANTLSASGPVNRALCGMNEEDLLICTEEVEGLVAGSEGTITDAQGRELDPEAVVSMNLWVLRHSLSGLFRAQFGSTAREGAEYGLPEVVHAAIARGHCFRALRTNDTWCGLTYPADAELVRRTLSART